MPTQWLRKDMKKTKSVMFGDKTLGQIVVKHDYHMEPVSMQQDGLTWMALLTTRYTAVQLLLPNGETVVEGLAVCSPKDTFSKKKGRQLATTKLLAELSKVAGFTKAERQAVFDYVCPEYRAKAKDHVATESARVVNTPAAEVQDGAATV